jgi:LEA14-like dessication related protein
MLAVEILEGIRMMLRMANLICVGAALALLAGCTSVEERLELRKPTARLVGVRFQEATPRAATLVFDVELQNYYPLTVPLVGFKYSVSSAGQMFLSGSSEARVNLPASSQRTVALPSSTTTATPPMPCGPRPSKSPRPITARNSGQKC